MANKTSFAAGDRQRYHHGDLRRHLLRFAREEVARNGAKSVSMASLARLAGVSQPAPYRHFADREALLEGVAAAGFEEFAAKLTKAMADQMPVDALKAIALAYVAFGESNIELYRLMFASRVTPQARPGSDLDEASGKAFELLRTVALAISSSTSLEDTYIVWAQLHGLVMLKVDGFITRPLSTFIDLTNFLNRRDT